MQIGKTGTCAAARTTQPIAANQGVPAQAATGNGASPAATGNGHASVTGGLRTQVPAILTESPNDDASRLSSASFAEMVAKKTQDFSKTLMSALQASKIPTDEPITLRLDGAGNVTADGPSKERIEKMFKERPELAQQLKDVSGLNSMMALNEAMRRFSDARKNARDDDERNLAQANYLSDCLNIEARSDTMVLDGGQLMSPAVAYIMTR